MFVGAVFLKLPQIINIIQSKSVEGLSSYALYSDVPLVLTSIMYNILQDNPFTSYGESIAILLQNFGIVVLFWIYSRPKVPLSEIGVVLAIFMVVFVICSNLPDNLQPLLILSNLPLLIAARVPQIVKNYQEKTTGPISFITTFLSFAGLRLERNLLLQFLIFLILLIGSAVRILTTIIEVGWDFSLLTSYFIATSLSGALLIQIFIYKDSKSPKKSS